MSEKFREFVEIPQEFYKDGQQVSSLVLCWRMTTADQESSSSLVARSPRKKVGSRPNDELAAYLSTVQSSYRSARQWRSALPSWASSATSSSSSTSQCESLPYDPVAANSFARRNNILVYVSRFCVPDLHCSYLLQWWCLVRSLGIACIVWILIIARFTTWRFTTTCP